MKTRSSTFIDFIKKHKILTIISAILLVVIATWNIDNLTPHPLGDRMEYLGKEDYGCIWICDAEPSSIYYYGTDMDTKEIIQYFKFAKIDFVNQESDATTLSLTKDNKKIYISLYEDKTNIQGFNTQHTMKKNVLRFRADYYELLKKSL